MIGCLVVVNRHSFCEMTHGLSQALSVLGRVSQVNLLTFPKSFSNCKPTVYCNLTGKFTTAFNMCSDADSHKDNKS